MVCPSPPQQQQNPPSEQLTLRLNAQAIALLQQKQDKKALDCFKKALNYLRMIVCSNSGKSKAASENRDNEAAKEDSNDSVDTSIVVKSVAAPSMRPALLTASPDNAFIISNRVFSISGGASASELVSAEHHDLTTTVFLYNTGLAFHRRAVQSNIDADNKSSHNLRQALSLYKAAYLSLFNHANRHRGDGALDGLLIALVNNMGHIHSHFYDKRQTKVIQAKLLRLLKSPRCARFMMDVDDSVAFFLDGVACFARSEIKSASAA